MTNNYLNQFIEAMNSGTATSVSEFSAGVQQDMNKSVLDLAKDQVLFDIEALDGVREVIEDSKEFTVYRYTGRFVYGFLKQGISHYIPGDLSSAVSREEHTDGGEIVFYVCKQTGLVEGIYESFAANSFGIVPKRKKLFGIF